jgi:Predicted membrane protein
MNEDPIGLWQHVHGATTHFPIAMAVTSIAFDLGALLFKKESWRTVAFWLLIIAAIGVVPAITSGLFYIYRDPKGMEHAQMMGDIATVLSHRNVSLFAGALLIFLALWRVGMKDRLKGISLGIYLLLAVIMVGGIGYAGYLGGYLGHGYWGPLTPAEETPAAPEGAQ